MQLYQLTPHVYYTPNCRENDRPVLGYIRGERFSVMVDAGNSAAHVQEYQEAVASAGLPAPAWCAITHWHWDHTFGMHQLKQPIIAHENTNRELRRMLPWQWDEASMLQRLQTGEEIEFAHRCILAEYPDSTAIRIRLADVTVEQGLTLNCGGITCRCLHLPSAHSDDSLVLLVPEEKVLFIGDIYGDDYYNGRYRDVAKTQALYTALEQLDFTLAVPGHSGPMLKAELLSFLQSCLTNSGC